MGAPPLVGGSVLALLLVLLAVGFGCSAATSPAEVVFPVAGATECLDCAEMKIKNEDAFKGLHVAIKCKASSGEYEIKAACELNDEGKFTAHLPADLVQDSGELKTKCFVQLHGFSNNPCADLTGLKPSMVALKPKHDGNNVFVPEGKLLFSSATCASAIFWHFFWHYHKHFPWHKPYYKPPVYQKPVPPPTPVYQKPVPPPTPVYQKPVPPPTPVYQKPVPPPTPVYQKPVPPPTPVYQKPIPPPTPVYQKPRPPPVPIYKPPVTSPCPPVTETPVPPPTPVYKKPLPPPVPVYKPPVYEKPPPSPVPIYKPPVYKKPLPPLPKWPPFHHYYTHPPHPKFKLPPSHGWPPMPPFSFHHNLKHPIFPPTKEVTPNP